MITDKLYQGVIILLLVGCSLLSYKWWDARTDATTAHTAQLTAEKALSDEQTVTANQRTALSEQSDSIAALETAKKAAEARVQLLTAKVAAYQRRAANALSEAEKVDSSKMVSCDAAMPTLRSILKGVRP
jgi:predicted ribosome quality control (RQC) complex YloA/Tae2 family protein